TMNAANATLNDSGTLILGSSLTVQNGTFQLEGSGSIVGGTLTLTGGTFTWSGGVLDEVTYQGTLDLTAQSSSVEIANGLTATGVGGAGPGTVTLGDYSVVTFDDNQSIDNATITLGGYNDRLYQSATYAAYQANGNQYATQTLTLGA